MSSSRGTSLLEACVVVAIISSLTMIAVPSLVEARQHWLLQSAAYQIRSELHYARVQSIMRMQDCRLRVTSPVTYRIECQTPAWLPLRYGKMPPKLTVTANNRPEFHPLGNVPQWSLQNRPTMVTSKPANGDGPGRCCSTSLGLDSASPF